jgi:hypothetical protein
LNACVLSANNGKLFSLEIRDVGPQGLLHLIAV